MKHYRNIAAIVLICSLAIISTACGGKNNNAAEVETNDRNQEAINSRYNTTDIFKVFYTWDYPAKFSKQRNEVFSLFEEIERDGGKIADNPDVIKVKSKIGLKHEFIKYIVSDASTDDDVYLYYGSSKDGVPDGTGILFERETGLPAFAGYFDNGKVNDYGMIFKIGEMAFESEKCKYKGDGAFFANGDSIQYETTTNSQYFRNAYSIAYVDTGYSVLEIPYVLSIPPSVIYEGEMSDSKSSGKGKQYYSIYRSESATPSENVYGPLCYDGDWKYDVYHGRGKLYDDMGNLKYEGKFSNGKIKN